MDQRLRPFPAALVWIVTALEVAALLAALPFHADTPDSPFIVLFVFTADALAFGLVGALIVARRRANAVGWILWAMGLGAGVNLVGQSVGALVMSADAWDLPGVAALALVLAWFIQWSFNPVLVMGVGLLPLLFPDGRLPSPRWRIVGVGFCASAVLVALPDLLRPGALGGTQLANPTGAPVLAPYLDGLATIGSLLTFLVVPLAVVAVVTRFRRGTTVERQQLKWVGAAMGATGVGLLLLTALPLADSLATLAFSGVILAFGLVPVAIGVAILRYRLYDIDRIISRTVSYAVLTAVLALLYGAGFLALQAVLQPFTKGGGPVAVAASTLVVFACFQPLRGRIQALVDRRFNRSRYDAEREIEGFAARVRDEVEVERVASALTAALDSTMQPSRVAVWLRDPHP